MRQRLILHLVARDGADLGPALAAVAEELTTMTRDPACFMGAASPFTAAVETTAGHRDTLADLATALGDRVDRRRSMALVGTDRVFIEPASPTPVRYQYLMRRRHDFTHDDYLARYESIHSGFGLRTPHIEGYVQLHVDLEASRGLGEATGLQAEPCDSMSELHLRSVEHFLEGIIDDPEIGRLATEDEERFVDRPRSFGFAHRVVQGSRP
ncbi:MAG: EthD domain-containing protein [Acidimicrobiales bacterium]